MTENSIFSGQKDTWKKVFHYIGRYWYMVVLSLLLAVVTVALTLVIPILTGEAIDLMIDKGLVDMAGILAIVKKIGVAVFVTAAAQWIMNTCNNFICYHVVQDIRRDAFRKIEILPLRYLDSHASGDVVSRVIADVDTFADGLLMGFTQLFTGALTIGGTLFFMFRENAWIALIVVVLTPLSMVTARFISRYSYRMFALQSEARGTQTALIHEMITHQKVVQAFS